MKLKHGDHKSMKKIVVLGAGVQGTVFGVRLAQRGNEVTLIGWRETANRCANLSLRYGKAGQR